MSRSEHSYNSTAIMIAVIVSISYFLAAFYPFSPALPKFAENGAIVQDDGSLLFNAHGIALANSTQDDSAGAVAGNVFSVLTSVRSSSIDQEGPARIVSMSLNPNLRNFTIAQEKSDLAVRIRRAGSNLNGLPEIIIPAVFLNDGWHDIETRIRPDAASVYVDGELRAQLTDETFTTESWDWTYPWSLGNEQTGNRPWLGEIRTAQYCIDSACIDLMHQDRLHIPPTFWIGDWSRILDRRQLLTGNLSDILVNVFGFVPFGLFLAWSRRPAIATTTALAIAFLLSLSLEFGQVIFEGRFTSIIDLICNTLGAGIGFVFARSIAQSGRFSQLS